MPYTKTTWQDGDIITTEKLNKIENGIEQASSGGGRIIDLTTLELRREVDPESDETFVYYFSGYEAGLSSSDFINAWIAWINGRSASVLNIHEDDDEISLEFSESTKPSPVLYYIPETGEFYFVQQEGDGGKPK